MEDVIVKINVNYMINFAFVIIIVTMKILILLNYVEQIKVSIKMFFIKTLKIENFLMIDDDNKIFDNYDGLSALNSNFSFFDKNNEKAFILPFPSQTLLNFSFHSLSEDNFIGKKRNIMLNKIITKILKYYIINK